MEKSNSKNHSNWEYKDIIKKLNDFKALVASKISERGAAEEINIPCSTIQNWQKPKKQLQRQGH